LIGYSEATKNDPQVLEGVFDIATLVPAVGFVALALILWLWYPLHKKQVEKNVKVLAERRNASQ
jgi:GPH family glycoside/pentoside/hexuronide:cation symporter